MSWIKFSLTAKQLKAFHGTCVWLWCLLWLVAGIFGWLSSVTFVSHISMATALLTSFAAWCSTRVEVKQDEGNDNDN
jgi:hypothetical protein